MLTTPIANAGIQLKNGATSAGFLEFFEDSDNGTNKATLIGPASTADVTITLPATTDTLVARTTTDVLTNKTLTTPTLTTPTANNGILLKNGSTSAGFLKFFEDSDNGTNGVTLIGPASTADVTVTLPAETATLIGTATTDTLTNKTLTTPVINAGAQLKNGATSAGFLQFFEDSDNGTNKATLIGPASTADVTITLPAVTGTVLTTANSDVGTTTSTAAEADFILIDNGGVLNKISPNNLGITASSIGFTTSSFTTTPGSDGNFDLAKVQEQTGSAESGLTTVSFDAFGIETGGSPDFYDLMDPRFADKSTDYGSVA